MSIIVKLPRQVKNIEVDRLPQVCPYCHKTIESLLITDNFSYSLIELVFKCPNAYCNRIFIAKYHTGNQYNCWYEGSNFGTPEEEVFSEHINKISPSFVKIFNQAHFAEQHGLVEICGVGYRKSLEFLIKDYLILKNPQKEENIKKKFLGNCIKDDVQNPNIRQIAERAVWLGNDETHYIRQWEDKNVVDLKKLIMITIHWIDLEETTESLINDMAK